ncbi:MAG: hypothetical protein MJ179_07830 [Treponema sp.]|nr:hypothetical protein [Treponema sp.]
MKKILISLSVALAVALALFAQEIPQSDYQPTQEEFETQIAKTETIIPKNQHLTNETGSVRIEYQPIYDEVRIYYDCMYVTFDRGEAMNTVLECLADFQKEHKYFGYRYMAEDRTRFYKDDNGRRKAQYISYVKFSR